MIVIGLLEHLTHVTVLLFYAIALVAAFSANLKAGLWARRVATIAMMVIAVFWIYFYILVVPISNNEDLSKTALWSRIGHYITATSIFVMALVIRRSEKYGLSGILNPDEET